MKKFATLIMTLALLCTLCLPVFAAAPGSITINGIQKDTVYEIYQLLDLESYDKTSGAYSYKVNADWATYFTTDEAKAYFTVDESNYATWIAGDNDAVVAEFAQKALAYAQANGIAPVKSSANEGEFVIDGTTGKFENLALGYYLVDSNVGALCGLTTTDPDASIVAKNGVPTIDKQVQEDLDSTWGDANTADIGQIVNFKSIIHVASGAENYVMHDKMDEGLTFVQNLDENRGVTSIVRIANDGSETTLALGTDYTVKTAEFDDECTFEVVFTDTLVASLKNNERLVVYYNAMLNRNALVGADNGNANESWLEYGEEHYTSHDQTNTYTFSLDIIKTDSSNNLIDGAEFRIYDAAVAGNEIAVVPLMESDNVTPVLDANGNPMYRRARADETGVNIVVEDGKVTVVGFDNGVYYLEEVKAPEGYNQLASRKEFTISGANLDSVFNGDIYSTGSGVHVVNKTGSMLPETGGIGTVIFWSVGLMAVLGTGVLLVTKKRMGKIED